MKKLWKILLWQGAHTTFQEFSSWVRVFLLGLKKWFDYKIPIS